MGALPLKEGHSSGLELRYQATLSGPGTATPVLTKVQVTFSGDNPTTEYDYSYDSAGNMTEVDTITAAGVATEVRDSASWPAADQINNLNQILRNDVTPVGGSTTTYRYTYNGDGTMATRTDGTTTWTYNWDPVGTQRLLSVDVDGVAQVAYTYDSVGRMLTRTPYSGGVAGAATSFEWDGMTVVRETTPNGVYRYYAPQGELITFDYTPNGGATASYSAHADAIGSVRAITDASGALVAHFEYDAWGNLLPTSVFGPLPDWSYLFVGSLGVRRDAATGLYYMRQRWYDPGLERFVSRDPLGHATSGPSLYAYSWNGPANVVDPTGMIVSGLGQAGVSMEFSDALGIINRLSGTNFFYRTEALMLSGLDRTGYIRINDPLVNAEDAMAETRWGAQWGWHGINLSGTVVGAGLFSDCEVRSHPNLRFRLAVQLAGILAHEGYHWHYSIRREPPAWHFELNFYRDLFLHEWSRYLRGQSSTARLNIVWSWARGRLEAGRRFGYIKGPNFFDFASQFPGVHQ